MYHIYNRGLASLFRRALHITQSLRTRAADVSSGDIARKLGQRVGNAGHGLESYVMVYLYHGAGTVYADDKQALHRTTPPV